MNPPCGCVERPLLFESSGRYGAARPSAAAGWLNADQRSSRGQRIIGLTILNAQDLLDRDGRLIVTVPETVEASADDLAPALHAA